MTAGILIVEDEAVLGKNVQRYLQREGYDVRIAPTLAEGKRQAVDFAPDVVLLDLALPDGNGLSLLNEIRTRDGHTKVIVMTGHGDVQTAVEAMRAGAFDYVGKPVALGEIKLLVAKALDQERIEETLTYYQDREARGSGLGQMIGESPAMQQLKAAIRRLLDAERALGDEPAPAVLIRGETGSGKELVARALHFEGRRGKGPFMEINCAALPQQLVEGELFGHERGAFTDARERRVGLVEAAHGGTLFLDEIGDLEAPVQVKLLKLLEDRTVRRLGSARDRHVDVRFVTATHRPLETLVAERTFRADLYYRLRVLTLDVPPLRERGADVLLLADHFLAEHARRYGKPGLRLDAQARETILRHPWPGNVRELRNAMEQAALSADSMVVRAANLALVPIGTPRAEPVTPSGDAAGADDDLTLPELERRAIMRAMDRYGGNVVRAARALGISRDTLRYRLAKYEQGPSDQGKP